MGTALGNIFAMYCIMMGAYLLKKRSSYPVEVDTVGGNLFYLRDMFSYD
jgi:hypothetical protein